MKGLRSFLSFKTTNLKKAAGCLTVPLDSRKIQGDFAPLDKKSLLPPLLKGVFLLISQGVVNLFPIELRG